LGKYVRKIYLSNLDLDFMISEGISQTSIPNVYCRKKIKNSRDRLCSYNLAI
jgi:hypothetical protein